MKRLLAALRFSNVKWNKSILQVELDNILELEKIMLELDNSKGLGVIQNNHANLLRKMAVKHKEQATDFLRQAEKCYESAVENARSVTSGSNESVEVNDKLNYTTTITNLEKDDDLNPKLLSRRLGLALVYMDKSLYQIEVQTVKEIIDICNSVIRSYVKLEDWKGLANLGYVITSHELQRKNPEIL